MYSMCSSVRLAKRVRCSTDAEGRRQRQLEMRVAIWGNLTHSVAVHHRCRETCVSHFIGRHQLMSTHKDAKYTSTGTCAYINARVGLMVCGVKTVLTCLPKNMQGHSIITHTCPYTHECTHPHTITLSLPYLHVCMEAFSLLELNRLIEWGRWIEGKKSN